MASTQAQKKATAKYEKANVVQIPVKLNKNTDADIIEFFNQFDDSRLGFIKAAIREKIEREG